MLVDPDGHPERCLECDGPAEHRHHVIPRSKCGTRTVPLCQDCHDLVHWRSDDTGSLVRHARSARLAMEKATRATMPQVVKPLDFKITASDIERARADGEHPPEFYAQLPGQGSSPPAMIAAAATT